MSTIRQLVGGCSTCCGSCSDCRRSRSYLSVCMRCSRRSISSVLKPQQDLCRASAFCFWCLNMMFMGPFIPVSYSLTVLLHRPAPEPAALGLQSFLLHTLTQTHKVMKRKRTNSRKGEPAGDLRQLLEKELFSFVITSGLSSGCDL